VSETERRERVVASKSWRALKEQQRFHIFPTIPTHHWVFDDVFEGDDVRAPAEVLQDLNFTLDFLLLDGL
jgi:hypothetical protein